MSEVRIARFVDMEACRSIFSDYSTFVLRSSEHYRRKYETDKGDEHELEVRLTGGGSAETSGFVLSCWTLLDGDEPTRDEWGIFQDIQDSVVAIVSTPSRVYTLLERAFDIEYGKIQGWRKFPFMSVEHKAVTYADEVAEKITFDNITDIPVFTKRLKFAKQKEYRFALPYSTATHSIDSYIFAVTPDYMEKCFINPKMSEEDKRKLQLTIMQGMDGYGPFSAKKMLKFLLT